MDCKKVHREGPDAAPFFIVPPPPQTNRNTAAGVVVHWLEEGIAKPARGRRPVKEALNIDTILETIRSTTLSPGGAERIVRALKERELIETAVVKARPGAE